MTKNHSQNINYNTTLLSKIVVLHVNKTIMCLCSIRLNINNDIVYL